MTAVVYIGTAAARTISSSDWAAVGISAPTVTWDADNSWSHPLTDFSSSQLDLLRGDALFDLRGETIDGGVDDDPRGSGGSFGFPATREWVLEQLGSGAVTLPGLIDLGTPYDSIGV